MRWRRGCSADKQAQRLFISLFFQQQTMSHRPTVQIWDTGHTSACELQLCYGPGSDNCGDSFWPWDNSYMVVFHPDAPVSSLWQGQQHPRWARERGCHGNHSQGPCTGFVPSAFLTIWYAPTLLSWITFCFRSLVLFSLYSTETWLMHLILEIRYLSFY